MKVQAHSPLEPPLEHNQDQMPLMNQGLLTFLAILGVTEILRSFRLVLEGKTGVLRKVFSKQFCFIRCRRRHLWAIEGV